MHFHFVSNSNKKKSEKSFRGDFLQRKNYEKFPSLIYYSVRIHPKLLISWWKRSIIKISRDKSSRSCVNRCRELKKQKRNLLEMIRDSIIPMHAQMFESFAEVFLVLFKAKNFTHCQWPRFPFSLRLRLQAIFFIRCFWIFLHK